MTSDGCGAPAERWLALWPHRHLKKAPDPLHGGPGQFLLLLPQEFSPGLADDLLRVLAAVG